ncbi:MAG: NAD(+)/NADH kinase [Chloroflexota bacterium]|nr:NAD(+)/NADH kinase [Dehalococcoidia bacterium]MDW8253572.1 NAD(+)/NADH kinase [Chloroflexota bacterium]
MSRIGLVYQPRTPAALELAEQTRLRLEREGHHVWKASAWAEEEVLAQLRDTALLITFGGDGTVLRIGRLSAPFEVPILTVNFGRLGFLTEVPPSEIENALEAYFGGRFWLERRILLEAQILPPAGRDAAPWDEHYHRRFSALNEVVVSRGGAARVIRLLIAIDDAPYTTYIADGAIFATPTGSTAYALAAGGAILDPSLETLMITPIAAHLGLQHSVVLPGDSTVTVEVRSDHGAYLSVDGQHDVLLQDGDRVRVARAEARASLVRLGPRSAFYAQLGERLTRRFLEPRDDHAR